VQLVPLVRRSRRVRSWPLVAGRACELSKWRRALVCDARVPGGGAGSNGGRSWHPWVIEWPHVITTAAAGVRGTHVPTQCHALLRDTGVLPRKEECGGCSGPPSSSWWRHAVAIVIAAIGALSCVRVADKASRACARCPLAPLLVVVCGGVLLWRAVAAGVVVGCTRWS
jgi:hypothetical protein